MQKDQSFYPGIPLKQKIALILFGLFLFILALEAGLRLGGAILSSIQEYRNLQSIKQKGTYRILCLGESTTGGQYPRFLEEALNRSNIGIHFSVIDKGVGGTNTSAILSKVESYIFEYNPSMVTVMMGVNDWGELVCFGVKNTYKAGSFIRSFKTYKLASLLWHHILAKAQEMRSGKSNDNKNRAGPIQVHFQGIRLKEAYAEVVSTEEAFQKALALNPQNDKVYIEMGMFYRDRGELPVAEEAFQKALALNPQNDKAYFGLGWIYLHQNRLSVAEEAFQKALALNSQNDNAHTELGWLYQSQGEFSLSEEAFQKALALNPQNDNAYFGLGWIYRLQNKFSLAREAFNKSIQINPKNGGVYVELGWLYQSQGEFSLAEEAFQKALALNPQNDKAYGAICLLYKNTGRPQLAKEYAQKANRLRLEYYNPATVRNYRRLKNILHKKGIRLVCVQYPMRSVEPLKKIFEKDDNIIFVDNEKIFQEALRKADSNEYFSDMFAGDFGHCTEKGNKLLAQNIADAILEEVFNKLPN
ncbi:MAG: tetratricopeptide repeat protein [Candidatus Omnitrophica bacterium]|nr:tetratricopeptide repeat protein [Candidatus Omnitrophota bacterium]